MRDLSLHQASTEEVAQSLLFQGSTCRKVAETSMNQCSSRSHTIFTIMFTAKSTHSDIDVITRYVLNKRHDIVCNRSIACSIKKEEIEENFCQITRISFIPLKTITA